MKPATIKAMQELCDALIKSTWHGKHGVINAADRLKRVLDEEPKGHCDQCAPEFDCWANPERCRKF